MSTPVFVGHMQIPDVIGDDLPRSYAVFDRQLYGEPYAAALPDGRFILVIEGESGCPEGRIVSEAFYRAWCAEFGAAVAA